MTGNCKDCKWWDRGGFHPVCDFVQHWDSLDGDNGAEVFAYADDDQGLHSEFRTGPMFGCVRFEPLQDTTIDVG